MAIFTVTVLVIILVILQHLLNWGWREFNEDEEETTLMVISTIVVLIISYFIVFFILKWGCLINLN